MLFSEIFSSFSPKKSEKTHPEVSKPRDSRGRHSLAVQLDGATLEPADISIWSEVSDLLFIPVGKYRCRRVFKKWPKHDQNKLDTFWTFLKFSEKHGKMMKNMGWFQSWYGIFSSIYMHFNCAFFSWCHTRCLETDTFIYIPHVQMYTWNMAIPCLHNIYNM